MQILFIRHGEPDYCHVTERGFIGHGQDMAQLTELGITQALSLVKDARLEGVELVLTSPYTRALQTAAIISRHRDIDLVVEIDLHEWIPDLSYSCTDEKEKEAIFELFVQNKGTCPVHSPIRYEEMQHVFGRVSATLRKYQTCEKIALVTHGLVISAFCHPIMTPWGGITMYEFTDDATWKGWV